MVKIRNIACGPPPDHKKVGHLGAPDGLTEPFKMPICFSMETRSTILGWLNACVCVAFAFALVLLPPSAAHAFSVLHDGHHVGSDSFEQDIPGYETDNSASMNMVDGSDSGTAAEKSDEIVLNTNGTSGQCCSDICFSAVLDENGPVIAKQVKSGKYRMLHAQTTSVDLAGFLRPPQYLI